MDEQWDDQWSTGELYGLNYRVSRRTDDQIQLQLCYDNSTTGGLFIAQRDIDVLNCLTNLHYIQGDSCISVKGSSCDNGYVSGGGRIDNLRILALGDGTSDRLKISSDQSRAFQAGWNSLLGQNIVGSFGPYATACTGYCNIPEMEFQANWLGSQSC